ncbi:MAG TPA: protein kinase [Gemmatimonadales bacterium]|nr:protein kinase [Gemmatimonadales bacterium]
MTELFDRLKGALGDRYQVEREVGRGGMATVFLAQDLRHHRPVAVKVLHPQLAVSLGPDRFLREIQIAARLQHPHIVPLYDSGQAGDLLYYVMPYVEGQSLRQRLEHEKPLPVEEAVNIARGVAAALDYAHRQQVVHRDIKPENVMLHEGEPLVTDFGIAKAVTAAAAQSLTQTGTAVGTPAYMSPEQAAGEAELDGRSDIYSLGSVLYEMLAGTAPFTGPTVQAIMAKLFANPVPPLRERHPEVPEWLDQTLLKALAKQASDRFATAAQFAQALTQHTGTTPPGATPTISGSQAGAAKSIAVLPFADMSPEHDQDYFCEGIAEEIINALTKIQALRVISRSSAFAFKGQNQDIRKVGEQLNVGTVLEGSIRKAGNRLRITAQLISVAGGHHLWSERYDRELEDVFAIQEEIAGNIVKALRVVLSEDEKRAIEKAPTDNVEAYEFYLRGRQYFHQWRRKSVEYARRMFERAIEMDPNYALAYAGIADCCSFMYTYWDASATNLERADAASRRALELDPESAEAHTSRGLALAFSKRYGEAETEFQTAIRLNPKLFEARYFFGRALQQQGRVTEAAQSFQEASRLRPDDYQARSFFALALRACGRVAESEAADIQALQTIERHLELNPEDSRALCLGAGHLVRVGGVAAREKALEWANRALAVDPEDSGMLYNIACLYSNLGEIQDALACLEKAVQSGFGLKGWIENDSDLVPLHGHPRFVALLNTL